MQNTGYNAQSNVCQLATFSWHNRVIKLEHNKTIRMTHKTSEDSDQPQNAQISLRIYPAWSVFTVRLKKVCVLSDSKDWLAWVDDPSLHWLHRMHRTFCWFCRVPAPHHWLMMAREWSIIIWHGFYVITKSMLNNIACCGAKILVNTIFETGATEILKSKSARSTDDVIDVRGTCVRQSQIITKTNDSSYHPKVYQKLIIFLILCCFSIGPKHIWVGKKAKMCLSKSDIKFLVFVYF